MDARAQAGAEDRSPVAPADVRTAAERIRPLAKRTPVMTSASFNTEAGASAFFKCENLQTGGAFKIRGASNKLAQLTPKSTVRFQRIGLAEAERLYTAKSAEQNEWLTRLATAETWAS